MLNILVERFPCLLPTIDHPAKFGGDFFLVGREEFQLGVPNGRLPVGNVPLGVQMDGKATIKEILAGGAEVGGDRQDQIVAAANRLARARGEEQAAQGPWRTAPRRPRR